MKTLPYDDMQGLLQEVEELPSENRKCLAIKIKLFNCLQYQPNAERKSHLALIAKTLEASPEELQNEFVRYESETKTIREAVPYTPPPDRTTPRAPQQVATTEQIEIIPLETESVQDLLAREIAPVRWIVKPLLAEGLAILAGPPKIGKSLICMGLAIAVSTGQRFLNKFVCEKGRVLYLGLEDSDARLQSRFKIMQDEAALEDYSLLEKSLTMRKSSDGGIEQIGQWLTEHPDSRLVIIDTLARIRRSPGRNANGYLSDTEFMAPLQSLALEHHVCIMLVHHTRKMVAVDPLDAISGTTGIAGVSDEILILKRIARANNNAILEIHGRDIEPIEIGISLDDKLRWNYEGSAEEIQKTGERQAVVDFLTENAGAIFSTSAIAKALEKKQGAVSKLLGILTHEGKVLSGGYGKYYIPKETI